MPFHKTTDKSEQLLLPLSLDESFLKGHLETVTGKTIDLSITDNSTSILSVRTRNTHVSVRLHHMFLKADNNVLKEISDFVKDRKREMPYVRSFIKQHSSSLKTKASRQILLRTDGRHHNLLNIYESVNRQYFEGRIMCSITWGQKKQRYAVKNRTLGSYSSATNTIRINPILDKKNVPGIYLEFIVYHEMLHAEMGTDEKNGRRSIHPKEFRQRERLFRYYDLAIEWETRSGCFKQ